MTRSNVPPAVPVGANFTLGQSPFRAKGVLYLGTQTFFDEHVRGGMGALAAEIDDELLRAFITQKFLPSGLYDVVPVPALIAYEARAMRMTLDGYLVHRTRHQAKKDLGGVYAWLLRLASARLVATRLPKIMLQMFDFAEAEVAVDDPERVVIRVGGVPAHLAPWFEVSLGVYAETALKLAGVTPSIVDPEIRPTGTKGGLPLVDLMLDLGWR